MSIYVPNLCPNSPMHGSGFCAEHVEALKKKGFHVTGKLFYKYI